MTPPNPRSDPGVISGSTFHSSNPAHPVVTQGIKKPASFLGLIFLSLVVVCVCFFAFSSFPFPHLSCFSEPRRHPLVRPVRVCHG